MKKLFLLMIICFAIMTCLKTQAHATQEPILEEHEQLIKINIKK